MYAGSPFKDDLMLEFKIQIPHIIFKAIMIHNVWNENMSLIFSTQTLFHRGSPKHEKKTRYMLINYFKAEKYDDGKEFELGKPEEWMMN